MQKTGEEIIFFQYGAGGVPLGFVYNGTQYFYITNQLGDVLGITDAQGNALVKYSYDEWGNPIQTVTRDNTEEQNKIAQLNPLRYRGYYYDAETGYYYLQSRYYNPKWGRFISPDSFDYIDNTTQLGCNAYIYCLNCPVMLADYTGTSALTGSGLAALLAALASAAADVLFVIYIVLIIVLTCGLAVLAFDSISFSSSQTKTLSDVKAKEIDKQSHYQIAYINSYGELVRLGKKLTFIQALAALGITATTNFISKRYSFVYYESKVSSDVKKAQSDKKIGESMQIHR